jgi:hypothetical protein
MKMLQNWDCSCLTVDIICEINNETLVVCQNYSHFKVQLELYTYERFILKKRKKVPHAYAKLTVASLFYI